MANDSFTVTIDDTAKMNSTMALANGGVSQDEYDVLKNLAYRAGTENPDTIKAYADQTPSGYTQKELDVAYKYSNWANEFKGKPIKVDSALEPGKAEPYNKDTHYAPPGAPTPDPKASNLPSVPNPPKPGEGADAGIGVDQNALRTFAGKLKQLQDLVRQIKTDVDGVTITPGNFGAGFALNAAVNGSANDPENGGVKDKLSKSLERINQVLFDIQDDAEATAKQYDSIEDMNSMTADQLNKVFRESFSEVGPQGGTK